MLSGSLIFLKSGDEDGVDMNIFPALHAINYLTKDRNAQTDEAGAVIVDSL